MFVQSLDLSLTPFVLFFFFLQVKGIDNWVSSSGIIQMEVPAFAAQGEGDYGIRKPYAESAEES